MESEKRSVELLSECGSEVKASSFDDDIVKGVWGNNSDRRLFKEKNIKGWSRGEFDVGIRNRKSEGKDNMK